MHIVEDCGCEGYLIQEVTDSSSSIEWISTVEVNGSLIALKLDTGAQVNILSLNDYK